MINPSVHRDDVATESMVGSQHKEPQRQGQRHEATQLDWSLSLPGGWQSSTKVSQFERTSIGSDVSTRSSSRDDASTRRSSRGFSPQSSLQPHRQSIGAGRHQAIESCQAPQRVASTSPRRVGPSAIDVPFSSHEGQRRPSRKCPCRPERRGQDRESAKKALFDFVAETQVLNHLQELAESRSPSSQYSSTSSITASHEGSTADAMQFVGALPASPPKCRVPPKESPTRSKSHRCRVGAEDVAAVRCQSSLPSPPAACRAVVANHASVRRQTQSTPDSKVEEVFDADRVFLAGSMLQVHPQFQRMASPPSRVVRTNAQAVDVVTSCSPLRCHRVSSSSSMFELHSALFARKEPPRFGIGAPPYAKHD